MARTQAAPRIEFFATILSGADFQDPTAVKAAYKQLCRLWHPDIVRANGGDVAAATEAMQAINNEYEYLLECLNGRQTYRHNEQTGQQEAYTYRYDAKAEDGLMKAIYDLLSVIGHEVKAGTIDVDVIGVWIWVKGNTKPYADKLGWEGIGFHWHSKRTAWYWKPAGHKATYSGKSLDELGQKYGRQRVYA